MEGKMMLTKLLAVVHDKERRALKALMKIYGDDVCAILNGVHALAARIAIASGIEPEAFVGGAKHHWDFLAGAVNGERSDNPH